MTATSTDFKPMTAQPHNLFVFCVVVVEFAVNGNQALVSFDKTHSLRCTSKRCMAGVKLTNIVGPTM